MIMSLEEFRAFLEFEESGVALTSKWWNEVLDFDLDEVLKQDRYFPKNEYYACKNFATTVATVGAGILSSNVITPLARNAMASKMQKNYINGKKQVEIKQQSTAQPTFKSLSMRI